MQSFDDFPGPGARGTTLFDEKAGTTTMTVTVLAASKEIRDAVVASGMEHDAAETYGWRLWWRRESKLQAEMRGLRADFATVR